MEQKNITNRSYLEALRHRILVFDGAMGTSLQAMNLDADAYGGTSLFGCNDCLVLSSPEIVKAVHHSFLEAGADVIETNTFRANRLTLKDYSMDNRVLEINLTAASIARKVADLHSTTEKPRFVAGSIGPSGKLISTDDPQMSDVSFEELSDVFCEQAIGLIKGGVDLVLIETSQDILEVKAAINGIVMAFKQTKIVLPIQAQITLDVTGKMLLGTDISAALTILEGMPIDVIGLNCSTGPEHMRQAIQYLGENSNLPVSCIPNAGLPLNINGEAVYPMGPEPFSDQLQEFAEKMGVRIVGGCCGTTPDHIRLLNSKISHVKPAEIRTKFVSNLASPIQAVSMQQEPAPFLIGERLNAQGSKKFKKLLMSEDYDGMIEIAKEQMASGAHGLDVCVALTERPDEANLMRKLVKRLSLEVPVPLIIDTTELEVLEAALRSYPGKSLINSTNLESGETKARSVMQLAKTYNSALMMLTIDEVGMAKTAERKLAIAKRLHDLAVLEFHLKSQNLVFDVLTFTLATGDPEFRNSAIETLEGIKLLKLNLPGVLTSLGVSNVSFGLSTSARKVINSVFLYHAVKAGLDMAIVNTAHIKPYTEIDHKEKELAERLIFNQNDDALSQLIAHFDQKPEEDTSASKISDDLALLLPEQRLFQRILTRQKNDIENDIDEILASHLQKNKSEMAVNILNSILLPAMKEVGERFGSGELILPFVLQSAEAMKRAVAHLESYLERKEGVSKGKLLLATVYGDVHDIGKNLVKTILSNNGYTVVDLGKQVPAETIINQAIQENVDAIGLSALLVSTSKQMPLIINELARRKLDFPVLIGGAAINPRFGWRILKTTDGSYYEPGVFYCKDAFEGLSVMDKLSDPITRKELIGDLHIKADYEQGHSNEQNLKIVDRSRSALPDASFIPKPTSWGVRVVNSMPIQLVSKHLAMNELFRLSWGAKNTHGEEWNKIHVEFQNRLQKMLKIAEKEKIIEPQAVYGYWPVQSDGNSLIIYDPSGFDKGNIIEIERFEFPRQETGENLCLADYFLPVESRKMDVVAFQVATVGARPTEYFYELESAGNFSEAYYWHGLAVQMAEAAADYIHEHIRKELHIPPKQGLRYSWGYPAIPELSDHQKVFNLLPVNSALAMHLTSAFQLVPEQSTAAIIVHHPSAKYFNVGVNRLNQLMN